MQYFCRIFDSAQARILRRNFVSFLHYSSSVLIYFLMRLFLSTILLF
nr:MAG TPA: hypothetical protein [Bacteriophage sp.]